MAITLEDVLNITYTFGHAWSLDGARVGYLHDDGGRVSLRAVDVASGEVTVLSDGSAPISAYDWAPDGTVAYVQEGRVMSRRPRGSAQVVFSPVARATSVHWSSAGVLAAVAGGRIWVIDLVAPSARELNLPGRVAAIDHEAALTWSPDGTAMAYTFEEDGRWDLGVADLSGTLRWRSHTENLEAPFTWLRSDRLLYARPSVDYRVREWVLLDVDNGMPQVVWREDEPKGLGSNFRAEPMPGGDGAVLILRHEGWWHLYLLDVERAALRALTGGDGEDVGHAYDHPRVSPDGREVTFSSNRRDLGQRHLYTVDVQSGEIRALVDAPGTSVEAEWSPDGSWIAFKHSTVRHAPEIWAVRRDGSDLRRLVGSMPPSVDDERLPRPQFVTFRTSDGWDIPNYLLVPRTLEPGQRAPALVYIHGGGMRQMRDGFNPLKAYAFFYAASLWLAELGYVSLMVNYRGGIGYGRDFEQGNSGALATGECLDVVEAGNFVKSLPYVDPERVGAWGISYGGWLTLAALCKSPETFSLGINIAGLYDFDHWMDWARRNYRPAWDYFYGRAGSQDEHSEVWHNASPRRWISQMRSPLVNLHGTKDEAVPFEQLDLIVKDCVTHGKRFVTHYYPDETHLFTHRATWRDALQKVAEALREHLAGRGAGVAPADA